MRTLKEIQQSILDARTQASSLSTLEVLTSSEQTLLTANSTSKVAIWRLWVWVIAFSMFIHEQLWSVFKKEITDEIASSRVHTREWYRQKALGFMLGTPIIAGTDKFNIVGLTAQAIEIAKVIKQAATVKLISAAGYGILRIKVAGKLGNDLIPVPLIHFNAFKEYMNKYVVDAGTQIVMTTGTGDDVRFAIDIYYNPLLLTPQGNLVIGGTQNIIIDAIKEYVQNISFNGRLILSDLEKNLRAIEGVEIAVIKEAASKYGQYQYAETGIQNVGLIDEIRVADSGYFIIDEQNTSINYRLIDE